MGQFLYFIKFNLIKIYRNMVAVFLFFISYHDAFALHIHQIIWRTLIRKH